MDVTGVDERTLGRDELARAFYLHVYEGGDPPGEATAGCDDEPVARSWAVDSFLFTDADLTEVLRWLDEHLPDDACWSLGVVLDPRVPQGEAQLDILWIVGADPHNSAPTPEEARAVEEMVARRHHVALT